MYGPWFNIVLVLCSQVEKEFVQKEVTLFMYKDGQLRKRFAGSTEALLLSLKQQQTLLGIYKCQTFNELGFACCIYMYMYM